MTKPIDYAKEKEHVLLENGTDQIYTVYTSFHEITQILAATKIYENAGSKGDIPELERRVSTGEIDMYFNGSIWEVKALYSWNNRIVQDAAWEDAETQLRKYEEADTSLKRGGEIDTIDGIQILGNLFMEISSIDDGKIVYSTYSYKKDGTREYNTYSNWKAANKIVNDPDYKGKKKSGGGKKGGGNRKK